MNNIKYHFYEIEGKRISIGVCSKSGLPDFIINIDNKDYLLSGESIYDDTRPVQNRHGTIIYLKTFRLANGDAGSEHLDLATKAISLYYKNTEPDCFVIFE